MWVFNPFTGNLDWTEEQSESETFGNLDSGLPDSTYGAVDPVDCGGVT